MKKQVAEPTEIVIKETNKEGFRNFSIEIQRGQP